MEEGSISSIACRFRVERNMCVERGGHWLVLWTRYVMTIATHETCWACENYWHLWPLSTLEVASLAWSLSGTSFSSHHKACEVQERDRRGWSGVQDHAICFVRAERKGQRTRSPSLPPVRSEQNRARGRPSQHNLAHKFRPHVSLGPPPRICFRKR